MSEYVERRGTVKTIGADGKPCGLITDMAEFCKHHPDNNLTPEQAIEAFLEGVAMARGQKPYVKYLEYSQRYMLVWAGMDTTDWLLKGNFNPVIDAMAGKGPDYVDAE